MDKLHITGYSRVEHDLSIPVYHAKLVDIKIKKLQAEIDVLKERANELEYEISTLN